MTNEPRISGMSLSFDIEVARQVGVDAAVVFNHILYWVRRNAIDRKNFKDGHYWMWEPMENMARYFGFMSKFTICRSVKRLVDKGYLIKADYCDNRFNRTSWYRPSNPEWIGNVAHVAGGPEAKSNKFTDVAVPQHRCCSPATSVNLFDFASGPPAT